MDLLEKAAKLARDKNMFDLLTCLSKVSTKQQPGKVFLITNVHPVDHAMRQIVLTNWDLLGKSCTTDFIHEKKFMVGYRRPNNLRDILVRANVACRQGDELARRPGQPPGTTQVVAQEETLAPPEASIKYRNPPK
jgi:hypothetical protein